MRFTPVIFAGLMAVAYAADSTTTAETPKATSGLTTEEQKCIKACPSGDVTCIAHCTPVPSPSEDDIAALNKCLTGCDQGDGSEAETIAYSNCSQKCVLENYYDPAVGTPNQGSSSSGGDSSSDSDSNGSDSNDSSDSSDSSSSDDKSGDDKSGDDADSSSDDSDNSASGLAASTWGLFGLVAAVLAF